jgi:TrmH family RNA methyltransferase
VRRTDTPQRIAGRADAARAYARALSVAAPATSARDPRVVRAAALLRDPAARRRERAVVLDGAALVRSALQLGAVPELVLGDPAGLDLPARVPVAPAHPDALRALAALGQAPAVVAVVALPDPPDPAVLPPRGLVLAGVADAGNAGAIVRTAAALGLPRVALTDGAADPFARKAVRAAQATCLRPGLVATAPATLAALAALPGRPPLAAAVARGGAPPAALPRGACVVLGAEGAGLPPDAVARCDLRVTIPAPGAESLNVAAAAAILAWHLA